MSYEQIYAQVQAIAHSQGRNYTVRLSNGTTAPLETAIERHLNPNDLVHIPGLEV